MRKSRLIFFFEIKRNIKGKKTNQVYFIDTTLNDFTTHLKNLKLGRLLFKFQI